jgi:creatinine amidohydrolase
VFTPDWGVDAHAGRSETSLMLAVSPERVHTDRAQAGNTTPLPALIGALRTHGVHQVSPNGVLGDPAGASAAEGSRMLERAADALAAQLTEWD